MTFPLNPSVGQETSVAGKRYRWNGELWTRISAVVSANLVNSASIIDNTIGLADLSNAVTSIIYAKANSSDLNTNNIPEGLNLYFTNARAVSALTAGTGISIQPNGLILGAVQYSNSDVQLYLGNVSGNVVPYGDELYSLGSPEHKWKDLFLSGNTIIIGNTKIESTGEGTVSFKSANAEITSAISFASNGYIAASLPEGDLGNLISIRDAFGSTLSTTFDLMDPKGTLTPSDFGVL